MPEPNHLLTLLAWLRRRGIAHAVGGLLALIAVATPLEGLFRATDRFGLVHPQFAIESKKRGLWVGKLWTPREFMAVSGFNEDGIRGPSLDARPGERHRVVVAGDSFVEGRQVPHARTFPIVSQSELDGVRVVPVRVGNHAFHERPERFLDFYERLFDGGNGRPAADGVVFSLREWPLVQTRPPRHAIQKALFNRSGLRRFLERYSIASLDVVAYTCRRLREWAESSNVSLEGTEAARRETTEAMIHSTLDVIEVHALKEKLRLGVHYIPAVPEVQAARRGMPPSWHPVDSLRAICAERDIPFEDATRDVTEHGGASPFFAYDGHPTEAGHRAMAPSLVRLLERMGYARD